MIQGVPRSAHASLGAIVLLLCNQLTLGNPLKLASADLLNPLNPLNQNAQVSTVNAAGLVYVSGTLPHDGSGAVVGVGDVSAQTRRVLERIRSALAASGSSLDQALAVTVYLRSATDFQAMNEAYRAFWPKDPPTRTTVITELVEPGALVEMSAIAAVSGGERVVIHPQGWIASLNPYSYAIKSGDTLFLSGLLSRNGRDNTAVPGDVATQTRVAMQNAGELLAAAGMTHANVVSARIYMPDLAGFEQMNEVYRGYFASVPPPARATVRAGLTSSQYAVEITMVASSARREAIDDGRPKSPNLSAAIRAGRRVYVSGMLGNTTAAGNDVAAQTRETLARLRTALSAAGCRPADVVDVLVYVTDVRSSSAADDASHAFFQDGSPARTTVQSGLAVPGGLVEIMMTAVTR